MAFFIIFMVSFLITHSSCSCLISGEKTIMTLKMMCLVKVTRVAFKSKVEAEPKEEVDHSDNIEAIAQE